MKYIAILDDEFLSNFRVDVRSNGQSCSDIVLVVTDKAGSTRGIGLKPLHRVMVVTDKGNSAYLNQEHIDCLIEMERKNMFDKAVKDMMDSFRRRRMTREEAKEVFLNRGFIDGIYNGDKWREACIVISKWLEQESTTKNDCALIHTEGLDEEIRCTMCTNSMKSDRGCDGSCVVNKDMYKAVMDAIEKRIQPTTKNNLGVEYISRADVNQVIEDYMDEQYHVLSDRTRERAHGAKVVKARINELPSVTPQEPKTGHWIANASQYDMLNPQYICSECGNAHTRTTPYCEMCGAKMVEPQESEG